MKLEAGAKYFIQDCENLTLLEKEQVKIAFSTILEHDGVCQRKDSQVCSLDKFAIICGKKSVRKRRSADGKMHAEVMSEAKMNLEFIAVKALNSSQDAQRICALLKIHPDDCVMDLAKVAYRRFLKASLLYAARQLKQFFKIPWNAHFRAAGRDFEAIGDTGLSVSNPFSQCDGGMVMQNDMCCEYR